MNEADALDIIQAAIWTLVLTAAPAVGAAMAIGLFIALFQALTQVQEATLTFVPKIIIVVVVLTLTAPLIGAQIFTFSEVLYSRIEKGFSH